VKNPVAAFAGMVTRMDRHVGQLLALLEELGIDDNTIVSFTSDNGPHMEGGHDPKFFDSNGPLKGHKRDLYEGGIRVPFVARWPGRIKAGTKTDLPVAMWDVMPTCLDIAGAEVPAGIDGISYLPALLGQMDRQKKHQYLYWAFYERGGKQAVRWGKWKGVRNNVSKDPNSPLELYDLTEDVGETTNVAAQHQDVVTKLETFMQDAYTPSPGWSFGGAKKRKR
jgi:arylsulfatase A-like enzyme